MQSFMENGGRGHIVLSEIGQMQEGKNSLCSICGKRPESRKGTTRDWKQGWQGGGGRRERR